MNAKNKMKRIVFVVSYSLFLAACSPSKFDIASPVQQESIHRVEEMPNLPQPFKILDFNEIAKNYIVN